MNVLLQEEDKKMFSKYLDRCNNYLEFGTGGSTYIASFKNNIKNIFTVDSDIIWQNKLKEKIKNINVKYIYIDVDTKPNNWGYPGDRATNLQKKNYSEQIKKIKDIDFVLIDGRFRVACCLKCHENCYIAFDDFLWRPNYHIVLDYFDIIEKTSNNSMVILRKKININIPEEIIEKYELIPE